MKHLRQLIAPALLIAILAVCGWGGVATAAEFAVSAPNAKRVVTINISGVIQKGDDLRFRASLAGVLPLLGIVILESPGGDLQAALNIGREISARAYATLVKSGAVCASACALAWLAGDWRYMAPGARIGFHAAYAKEGDALIEKGAANALIGAYLNTLKLSDEAIKYITKAAPNDVEWLSVNAAMHVGVNLMVAGENGE